MRKLHHLILLFFAFFIISGATWSTPDSSEEDYYYKLKKSWQQMQNVFEKLNLHYVEEIDPYPLVKAGIEGMLEKLDPYTQFIEQDGERRLRLITTGKYGGLGMEISIRNQKVTVVTPMDNSPAKRAGIRAGDIILKIDDAEVSNLNIDEVSARLRGETGTSVKLTLERPGLNQQIELNLTREEIVIEDVTYAGFIEPGVAYVSLRGFTDKAASELRRAIREMKQEGEIEKFVLDLRGNPGGLLDAAVEVVNIFVPAGETVVYTEGFREGKIVFKTKSSSILEDVPLAVLVDEGSASASEIVAGALQDLDRAVIVGEETFGKGLVQKVYNVDKNSDTKVKITTAKYYIPSGRSIQKADYGNNNDVILSEKENVSEKNLFFTRNKRQVYDHGGIYPDIEIKSDSMSFLVLELIRKNMFFNFAVDYSQKHPDLKENFTLNGSLYDEFIKYLDAKDFRYTSEGQEELNHLKHIVERKQNAANLKVLLAEVETQLNSMKEADFIENKNQILSYLKAELAEKYFGSKGREKYAIESDSQINKAIDVLNNQSQYNKILALN